MAARNSSSVIQHTATVKAYKGVHEIVIAQKQCIHQAILGLPSAKLSHPGWVVVVIPDSSMPKYYNSDAENIAALMK